jgi:hypothetical protein
VKPADVARASALSAAVRDYSDHVPLPGIASDVRLQVLVQQIIDSMRRVEFAHFIRDMKVDPARTDPNSGIFDPLRAAVYWLRRGDPDEAAWLIFLFVHFGKHPKDGYRLLTDIFGGLGQIIWTWRTIAANPDAFRRWLTDHSEVLRSDGVRRRFGNHRKYESLSGNSPNGTGAAIASYVDWIGNAGGLNTLIRAVHTQVGQNPKAVFAELYDSMSAVKRFGRLAKFDFLSMLGKLGIAPIEPDSAYLKEATGPLRGARLLFGGSVSAPISAGALERALKQLDERLNVGMQVLEDSLCNWQKSPDRYVYFRG